MADRAVWSVILAVEPDSRSRVLGSNQTFDNERHSRADGHHEHDAVEHLGVNEAVEVAGGDEAHDGYRQVGRGGSELQPVICPLKPKMASEMVHPMMNVPDRVPRTRAGS